VKHHTDREVGLTFLIDKKMAASSTHYLDILNWVKDVIKSINHPLQDAAAKKLINLYLDRYQNRFTLEERNSINRELRAVLDGVTYKIKNN